MTAGKHGTDCEYVSDEPFTKLLYVIYSKPATENIIDK